MRQISILHQTSPLTFNNVKTVQIYTTNGAEACHYIADHSKARIIVCENWSHVVKYLSVKDQLPNVVAIVMWEGYPPTEYTNIYAWSDFLEIGSTDVHSLEVILQSRMASQESGHCCTIIYTSGTTGEKCFVANIPALIIIC